MSECTKHEAQQMDYECSGEPCPFCRIAELEAWQNQVRMHFPGVAGIIDEDSGVGDE